MSARAVALALALCFNVAWGQTQCTVMQDGVNVCAQEIYVSAGTQEAETLLDSITIPVGEYMYCRWTLDVAAHVAIATDQTSRVYINLYTPEQWADFGTYTFDNAQSE